MAKRKVHYIAGCPNGYGANIEITSLLQNTTCGQCKGQILEAIRDMDWNTLPQEVLDFFWMIADAPN